MDNHGTLSGFLTGKIGIAVAAMALIGIASSMLATSNRFTERQELDRVADAIADAIKSADGFPGEVELRRQLSVNGLQLEVSLTGQWQDNLQRIRIRVASKIGIEKLLVVQTAVNGGNFRLLVKNPVEIVVRKTEGIEIWLI